MRKVIKKRCRTVQSKNAAEFDVLFNNTSDEIKADCELKWDGELCVHFLYDEEVMEPETVADEFKLQGIQYYCKDCPHLIKGSNKREKSHGCKYAEYGTVKDFTPACEFFYKQVLQGKITPEEDPYE